MLEKPEIRFIMTNQEMPDGLRSTWTADKVLALGRSYQGAAVLAAAAELDLFLPLASGPRTAQALADQLRCDLRGMVILLDALASLNLLEKNGNRYSLAGGIPDLLTPDGSQTVLAMTQHQANCLQRWTQLARVVKTGHPADRRPSLRGESGDQEAFIGAMDNISAPVADAVIRAIQPLQFVRLLDLGGASGTWTIAFLRACPSATALLFDLPPVMAMAQRRLADAHLANRVSLVAGDFMLDPLPSGADLAWVSAIVHQNSREQNRGLFGKVFQALAPGGRIAIRDILMDDTRLQPASGALFAVNMLVATEGGGTFTFDELRADLATCGFIEAAVARRDDTMNCIVVAKKPVD
jgi:precorrin-6B methylase 2